ncbi:unnamed protein product, partial [Mesorhabditis spiculigera]
MATEPLLSGPEMEAALKEPYGSTASTSDEPTPSTSSGARESKELEATGGSFSQKELEAAAGDPERHRTKLEEVSKNEHYPFGLSIVVILTVAMWFSTCHMTLCYPMYILMAHFVKKQSLREIHEDSVTIFKGRGISPMSMLLYVMPFLILWVAANYSYSRSLGSISASVATSISSCNTAIVYILAILLLGDKFVPHKLLSVVFAVAGVTVMAFDGEISGEVPGIVLSVISAASAACYKVCFKRVIGSASFPQVSLFMTCLGTLNLFINAAAILSLLFNFTINLGIAILHPLVISVGMLVGIPLNTAIDVVFRSVEPTVFFLT